MGLGRCLFFTGIVLEGLRRRFFIKGLIFLNIIEKQGDNLYIFPNFRAIAHWLEFIFEW